MPIYVYECSQGHQTEAYLLFADHQPTLRCACGVWAQQIMTAPLLVSATPEVCYDSPIDGRPITSMAARREDLARTGCVPYDPEQKTDLLDRRKAEDAALDRSIDASVEAAIEKMPTKRRAQLHSELTEQGADLKITRSTL